jgi:hypothetical protein
VFRRLGGYTDGLIFSGALCAVADGRVSGGNVGIISSMSRYVIIR